MNRYFVVSVHIFWIVMVVIVAAALNQADVYAADNLYKPPASDERRDRQEDLYKDTDSTSNLYQAPVSDERQDRQEDLHKDTDSTSNIYKPPADEQREERRRDIYQPR